MSNWEYNPGDTDGLLVWMLRKRELLLDTGIEIMEEAVQSAVPRQSELLEQAVTRTGIERVRSGRGEFAGRHVEGRMIGAITSYVTVEDDEGGNYTVVGRWGWPHPADYFLQQDQGTESIPAAHSLAMSFLFTRELFKARVLAAGSGNS